MKPVLFVTIVAGFYNYFCAALLGKFVNNRLKSHLLSDSIAGPGVTRALQEFMKVHNPREVFNVENLLKIYSGRESVLFQELYDQYGSPVLQANVDDLKSIASESKSPKEKYSWQDTWYPVAFEKFTDKIIPQAISILDKPLVLFFDHVENQWRMSDDVCPHRLVPLSEGRVDEKGCIECPYHGWSFHGESGKCTKIPQSKSTQILENPIYSVNTYPVVVKQGLIFMFARPIREVGSLPFPEKIPLCEPLDDPEVVGLDVSRDLPYDYSTLLENILDPSHVPFTHHGTIGNRNWANEVPLLVNGATTIAGFNGSYQFVPTTGPMTRQPTTTSSSPSPTSTSTSSSSASPTASSVSIIRHSTFRAPLYAHHSIARPDVQSWTVVYAVPSAPGRSRLFGRFPFKFSTSTSSSSSVSSGAEGGAVVETVAKFDKFKSNMRVALQKAVFRNVPDWLQHIQQNTVLDDDNIFLKLQEERVRSMGAGWRDYLSPTRADLFVAQFRKWLEVYGYPFAGYLRGEDVGGKGVRPPASSPHDPAQQRLQLLDRYSQHVLHCKPCKDALDRARLWRVRAVVLALCAPLVAQALELSIWALRSWRHSLLRAIFTSGWTLRRAVTDSTFAVATASYVGASALRPVAEGLLSVARFLRDVTPVALPLLGIAVYLGSEWVERQLTRGPWPPPRNAQSTAQA